MIAKYCIVLKDEQFANKISYKSNNQLISYKLEEFVNFGFIGEIHVHHMFNICKAHAITS